jgi:hypothetical protein
MQSMYVHSVSKAQRQRIMIESFNKKENFIELKVLHSLLSFDTFCWVFGSDKKSLVANEMRMGINVSYFQFLE